MARPISFTRRLVGCAANEKVVCACYDPRRWQSPYSAGISTSSSSKGRWLGEIEAGTAEEAIKIASERFGQEAKRLIAVRRG